jgi:two-component sensor histidine kinase
MVNPLSRVAVFGPAFYQGNSVYPIISITPLDLDTLLGNELAIAKQDPSGDSLWIEIYCGYNKNLLLSTTRAVVGRDISEKGDLEGHGWDGSVSSVQAIDLNNDGVKELVVGITVGFDLYPRGIYVYSYPSGKLLWHFLTAGAPSYPQFADANRDGFPEIYFKTLTSSNGAVVNGRSDDTSYIYSLYYQGYPIWSQILGDRFDFTTGDILVGDIDNDGTVDIYYTDRARSQDFDRQVRVLEKHRASDNEFLTQRSFDADEVYNQIYHARLDDDSAADLILNNFMGILHSADLSIVRIGHFSKATILLIADIDGDKDHTDEIVLASADSLYIVNQELQIIGSAQADPGCVFSQAVHFLRPNGENCLATLQGSITSDKPGFMRIYDVGRALAGKPGLPIKPIWPYAVMYGLGGLAAGILIGVTARNVSRRFHRGPHTAQYENLLTSLADFDHGRMAGKNLDRLLFLYSNLPDSSEKLEKIRPNIQAAVDAYQSFTSSQLDNLALYGGGLKPIQSMVEQLRRHKTELGELLKRYPVADLNLGESAAIQSEITTVIAKLKTDIRQIRKAVQSYFSADLLRVIPTVLIATVAQLRQQRVGFRSITTHGGPLRLAFFSEAELASIYEELLSNACDAMEDSEIKELSMSIDFGSEEVTISLSDTGQGLGGVDPEQLFHRGFSTKGKRGGFGLFHARQQVERFGGRIRLYDNEGGPGTTVELVLKAVNHE